MSTLLRKAAFSSIAFTSLGALIGTYSAILITSYSLLGPKAITSNGTVQYNYLRSDNVTEIESKLIQLEQGALTPKEAAKQIRDTLEKVKN